MILLDQRTVFHGESCIVKDKTINHIAKPVVFYIELVGVFTECARKQGVWQPEW